MHTSKEFETGKGVFLYEKRNSNIDFSESLKSTKGKNSLIPVPSLHIFNRNTFLGS